MKVFVIDTNMKPLDPVHPAEARLLLNQQKAAVFRQYPFTIIFKETVQPEKPHPEALWVKIYPGSRTTGIVVLKDTGELIFCNGCLKMCRPDKYGFLRTKSKPRDKKVRGFQTGNIVRATITSGKNT